LSADELAEFAARSVHATWLNREPNRDYLRSLLSQDDTSFFAHSSATFWVTGVSIGLANTVSTFPGFTVTPRSFKYAHPQQIGYVTPPALYCDAELVGDLSDFFDDAMSLHEDYIRRLVAHGFTRQQAYDAAIAVLPNCASTTLVVTASIETYRKALDEWLLPSADPELRNLAFSMLSHLQSVAPNAFQDFPQRLVQAIDLSRADDELSSALQESATLRAS
jgi:thymidylate synthase (FAD)